MLGNTNTEPEGWRPTDRPRRTRIQEDNIKVDLQEIGCDGVDWSEMANNRFFCRGLLAMEINFRVP
jgi:hypothetical protein